jgi:WD40 repeat protein
MIILKKSFVGFLALLLFSIAVSCGMGNNPIPDINSVPPPEMVRPSPTGTLTNTPLPSYTVTQTTTVTPLPRPSINYPITPGPVINSYNVRQLILLGSIKEKTYQNSRTTSRVAYQLDWAPDSHELALASDGDGIRFIDPLNMKDIGGIIEVNGEAINYQAAIDYNPNGGSIAAAITYGFHNVLGKIVFLDSTTYFLLSSEIITGADIFTMKYSNKGDMLGIGDLYGTVIYGMSDYQGIWSYGEHLIFVDFIAFSWDDKYFAFRGDYGTRMVNTNTWSFVEEFDNLQSGGVLCFSPNGKYFAQRPGLFSLENFNQLISLGNDLNVDVCEFGKESDIVINYDSTKDRIEIWDVETGELLSVIQGRGKSIYYMALSPDGRLLAIAMGDKSGKENAVEIWGIPA